MKHNYNDLTITADNNIPATICVYRSDSANCLQEALEDKATYHIFDLEDLFDIKLENFNLVNSMTIAEMFGNDSMMFAVHDNGQLFFEVDATELTEEFLESYRIGLINHLKGDQDYTILGWNPTFGGNFVYLAKYPANMQMHEVENAACALIRDIAMERSPDQDEFSLFVTNVLKGDHTEMFNKFDHTEGHDEYNFPIMKKWEYKLLSGNVLWCGGDYGTVEAHTEEDAMELAKEELATHFAEVNRRLQGFDTFEFSGDDIEVMEV